MRIRSRSGSFYVGKVNHEGTTKQMIVGCEYCHHPIHDNEDDDKTHVHLVTHKKGHRAYRLNFCDYDCVKRWLNNGQVSWHDEERKVSAIE